MNPSARIFQHWGQIPDFLCLPWVGQRFHWSLYFYQSFTGLSPNLGWNSAIRSGAHAPLPDDVVAIQGPSKTRKPWWFKPKKKDNPIMQSASWLVYFWLVNHELWSISCISSTVWIFSSLTWWTQWHLEVAGTADWYAAVEAPLNPSKSWLPTCVIPLYQ